MRLRLGTAPAPIEVRSAGVNSAPTSHAYNQIAGRLVPFATTSFADCSETATPICGRRAVFTSVPVYYEQLAAIVFRDLFWR
jgi:hypothetical protein